MPRVPRLASEEIDRRAQRYVDLFGIDAKARRVRQDMIRCYGHDRTDAAIDRVLAHG